MSDRSFNPNWVSPPGDTISDLLREQGSTVDDLAVSIGKTPSETNDLLAGNYPLTVRTAKNISAHVGGSVEFWMTRDGQYWGYLEQMETVGAKWVKEFPVKEIASFGWIDKSAPFDDPRTILDFFQAPNYATLMREYETTRQAVGFRASTTFETRPAALATWLRQGEIEGTAIKCEDLNLDGFKESLSSIRKLTQQKNPRVFLPKLQSICANNGVAVVVVRAPTGCRASGATRFLTENKALMLLSFRFLTDDHFWFTFFHEAGHLLLHSKSELFLEGENIDIENPLEEEADAFAADTLIPKYLESDLMKIRANYKDAIRFAVRAGISRGIVAGQLQHRGQINFSQLNRLKTRYKWTTQ